MCVFYGYFYRNNFVYNLFLLLHTLKSFTLLSPKLHRNCACFSGSALENLKKFSFQKVIIRTWLWWYLQKTMYIKRTSHFFFISLEINTSTFFLMKYWHFLKTIIGTFFHILFKTVLKIAENAREQVFLWFIYIFWAMQKF